MLLRESKKWRTSTSSRQAAIRRGHSFEMLESRNLMAGLYPNDPQFPQQWPLHNTGQTGGTYDADIDMPEAWSITTGSMSTVVAVLDSGIDYTHPDAYLNIWINESEIPNSIAASLNDVDSDGIITFRDLNAPANSLYVSNVNGNAYIDAGDLLTDTRWENALDDDGNGKIDDLVGWDFHDNDNDPYADLAVADHGTHISQRLAAIGNDGVGMVGVMWQARLMHARINLNNGPGNHETENCAAGLDYAVAEGASISNNSWVDNPYSQVMYDAIDRARLQNHLFIAAAGNDSRDNDTVPFYPASYDLDNVISVLALDSTDRPSSVTNWGQVTVDLGAPSDTGTTSKATPHVTGVAGLLRTLHPDWTHAQIKDRILATVDPLSSLAGKTVTGGRLNAGNALGYVGSSINAQLTFGTPVSLGSGVNTAEYDYAPTVTADGLNLLFARSPGPFIANIVEATRATTDVPFGNATSIGPDVNFDVASAHPAVSQDGLTLYYTAGNAPDERLYQTTRASRNEPFGAPESLGNLVGNQALESPSLSADGLTLFFTVWDSAHATNDIYQATRNSIGDPWGNVIMLSSAINLPGYNDAQPSISGDGLMLFFNSNRPGGFGAFDLYVSTRSSINAPWEPAINLGAQVNTARDDKGPSISADGRLLYFAAGEEDLYQVAVNYVNNAKFYVVNDATANQTFEYDATGAGVDTYSVHAGNTAPRGAASTAAGDKVWVVDANRNVYVYGPSGNRLGSWTAGSLNAAAVVEGITVSGNDVWIVDAKSDKVYRYAGAASRITGSQNATSSFSLNKSNTNPKDLVTNGTSIWVVENGTSTDKVFKYTLSGALVGSWTIASSGGSPTGITIDPSNVSDIWIVDSNTDRVYQFIAAASRTSGNQSPATSFALASGNTNPQGIADPPAGGSGIVVDVSATDATIEYAHRRIATERRAIDFVLANGDQAFARPARRVSRAIHALVST
jgi:hypothetical protein